MTIIKKSSMAALSTVVVVMATGGSSLAGSLTVYGDKASFLADTGATGTSPFVALGGSLPTFTHENLTFSSVAPNTLNLRATDWTTRLPGIDIAVNGTEHLDVDIANTINYFGFDFVEPEFDPRINASFVDSTFEVTLFSAGTSIGSFQFNAPNDVAAFVGVSSDKTFDGVEIREIIGGSENEFYGAFYTGKSKSVPEPSTALGLLALGVAGSLLKRKPANSQDS